MPLVLQGPKRDLHVSTHKSDYDILQRVANYQFLTVEQMAELLERNVISTRRRMMQLYRAGFLNRAQEHLNAPYAYFLAEKGGRKAAELGFLPSPRWTDRKDPHHVAHDLTITEFHLALEKALKGHSLSWEQWRGDLRLGPDLIPDAKFTIDGEAPSFLEVVRSYESEYRGGKSSLEKKLEAYHEAKIHRVLITMPTQARIAHFLAKIEDILPSTQFWFTDEDSFRKRILGKIWWTPRDFRDRTYSIFK